jgi:hypothetical protein
MIALGTVVVQIIRHRLEVLHGAAVRAFFLAVIAGLFSRDGTGCSSSSSAW